jgi:hypothetical protein
MAMALHEIVSISGNPPKELQIEMVAAGPHA